MADMGFGGILLVQDGRLTCVVRAVRCSGMSCIVVQHPAPAAPGCQGPCAVLAVPQQVVQPVAEREVLDPHNKLEEALQTAALCWVGSLARGMGDTGTCMGDTATCIGDTGPCMGDTDTCMGDTGTCQQATLGQQATASLRGAGPQDGPAQHKALWSLLPPLTCRLACNPVPGTLLSTSRMRVHVGYSTPGPTLLKVVCMFALPDQHVCMYVCLRKKVHT